MLDTTKLLALVNVANPPAAGQSALTAAQVSFGTPVADATGGGATNTKITLTSTDTAVGGGSVDMYYRRIGLSELVNADVISEATITNQMVIDALNNQNGSELALTDVDAFTIPAMVAGDVKTVVLNAKTGAIGWIGSVTVTLAYGVPTNMRAFNEFMNTTLPQGGYFVS